MIKRYILSIFQLPQDVLFSILRVQSFEYKVPRNDHGFPVHDFPLSSLILQQLQHVVYKSAPPKKRQVIIAGMKMRMRTGEFIIVDGEKGFFWWWSTFGLLLLNDRDVFDVFL